MDIDKIRDERLTEDTKMEMIADHLGNSGVGVTVVELHDASGALSDEDYEKILRDNTIIVMGTQYFYKQYSAATVIKYGAVPRFAAGEIVFDSIDIDRATKTFEWKHQEAVISLM